jgi:hypothetical protein
MTSTPRMTNGHPPGTKSPGIKPRKAGKKSAKKTETPEAVIAKAVEKLAAASSEPAPAPAKAAPAPAKATPAPAAPAAPLPKLAALPVPALDSAIDSFERSYKAAGQGAQALGAKLFDIARANVTSGFDFMNSLATAKHPADIARLQMSFWDVHVKTLFGQARDIRALSADIVAKTNEPIRAHIKKSFTAKAA